MTHPVPNAVYTQSTGSASTKVFITVFEDRDPTTSDTSYLVQQRWVNTVTWSEFILSGFTSSQGVVTADWRSLSSPPGTVLFLAGNSGGDVGPDSDGVINVVGDGTTINIVGVPGTNTLTASLVGGTLAIDTIGVDFASAPGSDPVVPNASGQVEFTAAQIATGTIGANVIRVASLAANTATWQIQQSAAAASKTTSLNGVSHYNSAHFTVDEGFVSLSGGGAAIDSITPGSGIVVVPNASGNVSFPNGNGIATVGTLNTLTTNMNSPFTGANFTFQDTLVGNDVTLQVANLSNTANASALLKATIPGTTAKDAFTLYEVFGVNSWSTGILGSDSSYRIAPVNTGLGTGDALVITTNLASANFNVSSLQNVHTDAGSLTQITVVNSSAAASSSGRFVANATDTSGDAYYMTNPHLGAVSANYFQLGQTQADLFKLTITTSNTAPYVINGTDVFVYDPIGANDFIFNVTDLGNEHSTSNSFVQLSNVNTAVNSDASARVTIATQDTGGDAYVLFDTHSGDPSVRAFGIGQTQADLFKINYITNTSAPNISGTGLVEINATGQTSILAGDLLVTRANVAGLVSAAVQQLDNTSATSSARLNLNVGPSGGGGTAGDTYIQFVHHPTGSIWNLGQKGTNNTFQLLRSLSAATTLMNGTITLSIDDATGAISFGNTASAGSFYTFPTTDGLAGQQLTTNGAGTVVWSSPAAIIPYTNVNAGMSPYTVLTTDHYISVDTSGGAVTLRFPNAATVSQTFTVKDRTGTADTNNITITTVGGAVNIDGATTFVMNTEYQAVNLMGNSVSYEVF